MIFRHDSHRKFRFMDQIEVDIWGKYEEKRLRGFKRMKVRRERYFQSEHTRRQLPTMRKRVMRLHAYAFRQYHQDLSFKQIKQISIKKHSFHESSSYKAPYLYECLLSIVIYRMNLFFSMYQASRAVKLGHFTVNGKTIMNTMYCIEAGDIIEPHMTYFKFYLFQARNLLRKGRLLVDIPECFKYQQRCLSAKLWRSPYYSDAPYYFPFGSASGAYIVTYY